MTYTSYDNPLLTPGLIQELEDDVPRVVRRQEIRGEFIDLGDEEIFKLEWFTNKMRYEIPPDYLLGRRIMSLDTAFKKGAENDDSAGVVFQEFFIDKIPHWLWLDTFCEKLEFPELLKKSKEFYYRWRPDVCLVEDKASGTSLIQMLRSRAGFPIKAITPNTDKVSRAVAVTPWFDNGQIWLLFGAWNDYAIDQLCDFNALLDTPDDIVDAVTQFLNYIKSSGFVSPLPVSRPRREPRSKITKGYPGALTRRPSRKSKSNILEGYLNG